MQKGTMVYNIYKACRIISISCVVFSLTIPRLNAQTGGLNKYGLLVISDSATFFNSIKATAGKRMLDIKKSIPGIRFDLKYSSSANFMHLQLYPAMATSYLRADAVQALAQVQKEMIASGKCLKIWDAYRPYSVTEKMWEVVQDTRYAASPKSGSGHNRGTAVDLTITDLRTGREYNMGTGFDNFTDTAHTDFEALPADVLANRKLLKDTMEQHGFKVLQTEWWHFYLARSPEYELLDLDFNSLRRWNR